MTPGKKKNSTPRSFLPSMGDIPPKTRPAFPEPERMARIQMRSFWFNSQTFDDRGIALKLFLIESGNFFPVHAGRGTSRFPQVFLEFWVLASFQEGAFQNLNDFLRCPRGYGNTPPHHLNDVIPQLFDCGNIRNGW
jgi:hypothetical protein